MKINFENVSKYYGTKCAVNSISMELSDGVYGLLGPNGAGKTTLMNMLASDMCSTEGRILCDGKDIFQLGKKYRKIIGYMPQQQGIYSYFTGERFLAYMAALKGMDAKNASVQIRNAARAVNLEEKLGCKIGGYSGGMKQRLLIAQSILDNPKVLILDEPTAGLDPKERIRIRNLISKISKDKIVLIATHVVQDIEYIAKEIIIIKNGSLVCKSSPKEIITSISEHVFEINCDEDEVTDIVNKYLVTNLARDKEKVRVRIISSEKPVEYIINKVLPTLEDYYLYEFNDENVFRQE